MPAMVRPGRLFAALVLGILGAVLLAVAAPVSAADPVVTLEANLTGEQEVPGPGDRDGSGDAKLLVSPGKVCYLLSAEDIRRPMAAHIHEARRGVAGPVVVTLNTPRGTALTGFSSRGCERVSRAFSRDLRKHPARYYVNVHNNQFPAGAIRGQLSR